MINEQVLLFRDSKGNYLPHDTINDELCVLVGSKEKVLERLREAVELYTEVNPKEIIDDSHVVIEVNDKCTIYDFKRKQIVTDFYDDIKGVNKEGVATVKIDGKFCFIDLEKDKILSEAYWTEVGSFSEGLMMVKDAKTNRWGYLDENFEKVIDYKFDESREFNEDMAVVIKYIQSVDELNNLELSLSDAEKEIVKEYLTERQIVKVYGYINRKGELAIPYQFSSANKFSEDMSFTQTFEEIYKNYDGGAFIDKNGKRYKYLKKTPDTHFHDGESFIFDEGGHYERDRAYVIDKNMNVREVSLKYYLDKRYGREEEEERKRKYRIVPDKSREYRFKKLVKDGEKVEIEVFDSIQDRVIDFYSNGKNDGNIYAYNLKTNQIEPVFDFVIGSRNILSEEETKPYIRKRAL